MLINFRWRDKRSPTIFAAEQKSHAYTQHIYKWQRLETKEQAMKWFSSKLVWEHFFLVCFNKTSSSSLYVDLFSSLALTLFKPCICIYTLFVKSVLSLIRFRIFCMRYLSLYIVLIASSYASDLLFFLSSNTICVWCVFGLKRVVSCTHTHTVSEEGQTTRKIAFHLNNQWRIFSERIDRSNVRTWS